MSIQTRVETFTCVAVAHELWSVTMETEDPAAVRFRTANELAMIVFRQTRTDYGDCMQIAEDIVKSVEAGKLTYITGLDGEGMDLPREDLSYEDFCDAYDDHVQWRDWTSLEYLCEEYPHHLKRLRSRP